MVVRGTNAVAGFHCTYQPLSRKLPTPLTKAQTANTLIHLTFQREQS